MQKTAAILLFFFLCVFLFVSTAIATDITIFGPEKFIRTKGETNPYINSFSAQEDEARIVVINGDPDGKNRVSSATVSINGVAVFKTNDFNQQVDVLEAPLSLFRDNSISVELNSQPDSYLTVEVFQKSAFNITITSPANNAVINSPYVMVRGTVENPAGGEVGVVVNGILAHVYGNKFIANRVWLPEETSTIKAKASNIFGSKTESAILVSHVADEKYLKISANKDSGIRPLDATITLDTFNLPSVSTTDLECSGPDIPTIIQESQTEYSVKLLVEGLYICTASVVDKQMNSYQDSIGLNIISRDEFDAILKARWQAMTNAITAGNVEEAVSYYTIKSQNLYREQFTALAPVIDQVAAEFANDKLLFVDVYDDTATYELITEREGQKFSFPLYFRKDDDGLWRIGAF